jgi:hypothetical protein
VAVFFRVLHETEGESSLCHFATTSTHRLSYPLSLCAHRADDTPHDTHSCSGKRKEFVFILFLRRYIFYLAISGRIIDAMASLMAFTPVAASAAGRPADLNPRAARASSSSSMAASAKAAVCFNGNGARTLRALSRRQRNATGATSSSKTTSSSSSDGDREQRRGFGAMPRGMGDTGSFFNDNDKVGLYKLNPVDP